MTSKLREYIRDTVLFLEDNGQYEEPHEGNNSYYRKPRPDRLKPGQVWEVRLLREWTEENPYAWGYYFVLTFVSEAEGFCKGFLFYTDESNSEDVLLLADVTDVRIPFDQSPAEAGVIMTWRGEVNLLPDHLKWYFGDIPEAKLLEARDKYAPVLLRPSEAPALNPEFKPIRDFLWKHTGEYDGETLSRLD